MSLVDTTSALTTKLNTIYTNIGHCRNELTVAGESTKFYCSKTFDQLTTLNAASPTVKNQLNNIQSIVKLKDKSDLKTILDNIYGEAQCIRNDTTDDSIKGMIAFNADDIKSIRDLDNTYQIGKIINVIKTKVDSLSGGSGGSVDLSAILQLNTDSTLKTYLTNCNNASQIINNTYAFSWGSMISAILQEVCLRLSNGSLKTAFDGLKTQMNDLKNQRALLQDDVTRY